MTSCRGAHLNFEELYGAFDASVTEFDCGQLCAPANGGIPACCNGDTTIPVLYKNEYAMLQGRSQLWSAWCPENAEEIEMRDELGDYQLAVCRGAAFCERENRSLNCRSFPFLPYIDHDGELAGLVFDYDSAEGKCPLLELPQVITVRYITESLAFWAKVLNLDLVECEFYSSASAALRRRFGRDKEPVPVLTIEGIRQYPTRQTDWKDLNRTGSEVPLEVFLRPSG